MRLERESRKKGYPVNADSLVNLVDFITDQY